MAFSSNHWCHCHHDLAFSLTTHTPFRRQSILHSTDIQRQCGKLHMPNRTFQILEIVLEALLSMCGCHTSCNGFC